MLLTVISKTSSSYPLKVLKSILYICAFWLKFKHSIPFFFFYSGDNVGLFDIDNENNLVAISDLKTFENEYRLMVEARDLAGHLTTHNITVWFSLCLFNIINYSNHDQPIIIQVNVRTPSQIAAMNASG